MLCLTAGEIETAYPSYLRDESKLPGGRAELLFFPTNEMELIAALKTLASRGMTATISGGRTGIVGGAVPDGGGLISLERMNQILGPEWRPKIGKWIVRLQAGVTVAGLNDYLQKTELSRDLASPEFDREDGAGPAHYFYPVDATEDSAQIGGNVATNASGARSFHYGPTRPHIHSLRLVLVDGTTLQVTRGECRADNSGRFREIFPGKDLVLPDYYSPAIKNAAGYFRQESMDLIDLFIGSEGTLAVISEVELVLSPKPGQILAFLIFCPNLENALSLVARAHSLPSTERPLAIEYFDRGSLNLLRNCGSETNDATLAGLPEAAAAIMVELAVTESAIEPTLELWEELLAGLGISPDTAWIEEEGKARNRLRHLRHALPETVNRLIASRQNVEPLLHKVSTDFAVPPDFLGQLIEHYQKALCNLDYVIFGHIGDAHLHANVLPRNLNELKAAKTAYHDIAHWVLSVGGTVSAEHGIGKLKRDMLELMYGPEAITQMRRVKGFFDPDGRLNPGVLLLPHTEPE
jgi:D-lactate dehydrogenase (cytochrome)